MNFYKPEDFESELYTSKDIADYANALLKERGVVVYYNPVNGNWSQCSGGVVSLKALIIGSEVVKQCEH